MWCSLKSLILHTRSVCQQRFIDRKSQNKFRQGVITNLSSMEIRRRVELSAEITPFQRRVYLELLKIPAGQTITYSELARRIGCRSAQAVGQALKRNPFAPYVPCHRVVAKDGSLCGYFGQRDGEHIERKRELLIEEKQYSQISRP